MWGAEGSTHDFSQSLSQLLNNNASISSINIAEQSYPVKEVIVTYSYNKSITNAVTIAVSVGDTDFGSKNIPSSTSPVSFKTNPQTSVSGAITITFTNNTGSGTGHGTFSVSNVRLVEGAPAATYDVNWSIKGVVIDTENTNGKPTVPDDVADLVADETCNGKVFVGWTANPTNDGSRPTDLFTTQAGTSISDDITYYAVFASVNIGDDEEVEYSFLTADDTSESIDAGWDITNTTNSYAATYGATWLRNNNAALPIFKFTPLANVSKISIKVRQSGTGGSNTVACSAGGTAIGSARSMSGTNQYDMDFEPTNASAGEIIITCTNTSGSGTGKNSFYVASITLTQQLVTYSDYATTCCTSLAPINGSVNVSQVAEGVNAGKLQVTWEEQTDKTGWADNGLVVKIYKEGTTEAIHTSTAQSKSATSYVSSVTPDYCSTYYAKLTPVKANNTYCEPEEGGTPVNFVKGGQYTYHVTLDGMQLKDGEDEETDNCSDFSAIYEVMGTNQLDLTEVSVTNAGEEGTGWEWNSTTGRLYIIAEAVTSNVEISITGNAPAVPQIVASPTSLNFNDPSSPKKDDVVAAKEFSLSGSNLQDSHTVTVTAPAGYKVSIGENEPATSLTITPSSGNVNATIKVTPITSTAGNFNGNVTISSDDLTNDVTVGLTMTVQETYTVNWYINNDATPYAHQTDVAGTTLDVPASSALNIDDCSDASLTFVDWTESAIGSTPAQSKPTFAEIGSTITANKSYYAVFAAGSAGSTTWTKATTIAAGDYLIVCEDQNVAFDGSLEGSSIDAAGNNQSVSISNGVLTMTNPDNYTVTLATVDGGYSIRTKSGYYLGSKELDNKSQEQNGMQNSTNNVFVNDISLDEDNNVVIIGHAGPYMRCNPNVNNQVANPWFRYYKSSSYTNQKAIQLYKKTTTPDTYNSWVTVCPHAYIVALSPETNGNGTISFAKNASAITEIETTGENAVTVDVVANPSTGYELTAVALTSNDVNVGQGGASYSNNVITIPANEEGTLTATATFAKANYAVTYTSPLNGSYTVKVGDAAAVSANTNAQYGQTITLAVVSEAEGYQFIGWTVTKTASSTAIAVDGNNQFTMPAEAVTVAANFQLIPANPAVVTFNAGAGTLVCNDCTNGTLTEESAGAGITLPSCTPPATGYAFLGWTTTQNKETIDDGAVSGATYLPAGDMPLYAVYTQLTAVTLKKGNGTDDVVLYADVTTGKVTLPSRSSKNQNYTFAGWSTTHYATEIEDANPSIIETGEYTPGNDITLYPVFSVQVPVTIWTKKTVAQVDGAGTYAIIDEDGYAFNGTMSSGHGQGTASAFSFTNNVASEAPTGICEITFAAVTGGYTLYNEDLGYLYATKAASGGLAWQESEDSYWKIHTDDNWLYNANSAYLRKFVSGTSHTFRTYAGASNNDLYFAKKESQNVTKYNAAPANDVAAPTFSPAAGAYYGAQDVTIDCTTNDVTIYYTDDESVPDENSTEYTTTFSVSSSKAIKAVAIDEDGYSSTVAEAAYTIYPVYNSIAAYQAASAQEAANARVLINKESANAIVIAVIGAYSYIQDGTAAMVIKRPNNSDPWTVGSELDGYVQGTRSTYYGLPMITVADVENVATSTGTPVSAQAVSNLNFAGAWSNYAGNLIKVSDVYFQAQATSGDKVDLKDGAANTGKLYDAIHFLGSAALPLTETACDITGILVAKTEDAVTTYYIAPTALTDISTKGAVAQLNVNPVGGADAEQATGIAPDGQVTVTPVEGFATTLGGEAITTVSTVPVTAPTSITVSATRQFYADNYQTYYYEVDYSYMPVTVTQPTNVGGSTISASPTSAQEGNTITLSYNLASHYHFNGWNVYKTDESGTKVTVTNNQFSMPAYAVTVEAEIEEDAYANVLFAAGGATSGAVPTDANKYYVGDEVTMPGKNTLAKSGSTFGGWSFGGNDYAENAKYTIVAADAEIGGNDITFTAQWTPYPWGGNGKWELVTDASTLAANDYLLIACVSQNVVAGLTLNNNQRLEDVAAAFSGTQATNIGEDAAFLTLGGTSSAWTFTNENDVQLTSTAAKTVKWSNTEGTRTWTIAIDAENEYKATIANTESAYGKIMYNSNNASYFSTYTSEPNNNMTLPKLYRFVAGNYYTITYAKGVAQAEEENVSNLPTAQVTESNGTATLSSEAPIYVGYTFMGWKDQDNNEYQPGADVTLTKDVTLTAQWEEATAHSLSYNLNGGTIASGEVPSATSYYPYAEVTVTDASLTKEDVIFIGWEYNGDVYGAGSSFTMPNENVVLTAKFAKGAIYTVATATSVTAQGAPEGSTATFENTYAANKEQMTGGKSMTLTLSGYKGYLIKNITLSMHANNSSGAGTFSATVGGNSIASIASAKDFNAWYDNNSYGSTYRDVHVTMTSYPAVGAYENVVIVIAATTNSLFCQSFTIEYEVAPVEINNEESVDASDILPGADVTINNGGTLVIDEEKELNDVTVKSGATVTVNETMQANNLVVENGGKVIVSENKALEAKDLIIQSTSGAYEVAGASGQLIKEENASAAVNGDIYLEIQLRSDDMDAEASRKWYCISAPFDVAINGGFFWGDDTPMVLNTDFQLFEWDGDRRASGSSGWRRTSSNMKAHTAYFIGFDDERTNQNTIKLKAMNKAINNVAKLNAPEHTGSADPDKYGNWNGLGNPNFHHIGLNKKVHAFNYNTQTYATYEIGDCNFVVGTPFFLNETGDIAVSVADENNQNYRAPKREGENYKFRVRIGKSGAEIADNHVYVLASETASASYEKGHDVITMNDETSKYSALIWTKNYGMRLAIEEAPLVDEKATYELGIFAPAAGAYSISVASAKENADLYLTYEGSIIWNLSEGEYTADLAKGSNTGYGLLLVKKVPMMPTGIDEVQGNKVQCTKVILDEKVFILRGGQMYDVTGKAVK